MNKVQIGFFLSVALELMSNLTYSKDSKLALIIGNEEYNYLPSLNNPISDAKLMTSALEELGFNVYFYSNLSQDKMEAAVDDFSDRLYEIEAGTMFFFYAGHGTQLRGQNQLLPVNYSAKSKYAPPPLSAEVIAVKLSENVNVRKFFVFDACRNSEIDGGSVFNVGKNFSLPANSLLAFSTNSGSTAADGSFENSPYARSLGAHLVTKGISATAVFGYASGDLYNLSDGHQVANYTSTLFGTYSFNPGDIEGDYGGAYLDEWDQAAWREAKAEGGSLAISGYIKNYPRGKYVDIARDKMKEINSSAKSRSNAKSTTLGISIMRKAIVGSGLVEYSIFEVSDGSPWVYDANPHDVIYKINDRSFSPSEGEDPNEFLDDTLKKSGRVKITVKRGDGSYELYYPK